MDDLPGTITALGTLVAAIGALFISYRNSRKADDARDKATVAAMKAHDAAVEAAAAKVEIIRVGDQVFEVGKRVDGRLSELLALTEKSAHAEGLKEGKADERARVADYKAKQ